MQTAAVRHEIDRTEFSLAQLHTKLNQLKWVLIRFDAIAKQDMQLRNPWSDLHGGFGMMLKFQAPQAWDTFFGERAGKADVRPYVLRPGVELHKPISKGAPFTFELLLLGSASQFAFDCIKTLVALSGQGLTPSRFRFEMTAVSRVSVDGNCLPVQSLADLQHTSHINEWMKVFASESDACAVTVELTSPLRVKHMDRTLETAPPPDIFANRLISRLKSLSVQEIGSPLFTPDEHAALLDDARAACPVASRVQFVRVNRWSSRQMSSMDMMGVVGRFTYLNVSPALLALLALGQYAHIGSNTTFGFGGYQLHTHA